VAVCVWRDRGARRPGAGAERFAPAQSNAYCSTKPDCYHHTDRCTLGDGHANRHSISHAYIHVAANCVPNRHTHYGTDGDPGADPDINPDSSACLRLNSGSGVSDGGAAISNTNHRAQVTPVMLPGPALPG